MRPDECVIWCVTGLAFDSLTAAMNLQQLAEMWSAQPKCLVSESGAKLRVVTKQEILF